MTGHPPHSDPAAAHALVAALTRAALARFADACLEQPGNALRSLGRQSAAFTQALGLPADAGWEPFSATVEERIATTGGPLAKLVRDLALRPRDLLLLGLAGEVEADLLMGVAVAELQAPSGNPRPGLHLAAEMLRMLYDDPTADAQTLAADPLVAAGMLEVEGAGPLPQRHLAMPPELWAVLRGRNDGWPGGRFLEPARPGLLPRRVVEQLPQIGTLLSEGSADGVVLRGVPRSGRGALAASLAAELGMRAIEVPSERWERDRALAAACRCAGWLPVLRPKFGAGEAFAPPARGVPLVVLAGRGGAVEAGRMMELEVPVLSLEERRALWNELVEEEELADQAAASAMLTGPAIQGVVEDARLIAGRRREPLRASHLLAARRQLGSDGLRLLAQPVDRDVPVEALVLPPGLKGDLEDLVRRCRNRESLWRGLGPTLDCTRSGGVRALFVGESGTGKTLAASYLATALEAPLYRVDLSAVMNKYIGESEKNLSLALDYAEAADVALLFDEADALFGRRGEGSGETGERYANMLTNFLLTRIENHPGIVVLTTNNRSRIDNAFTRRLDVVLDFPMPGAAERLGIWRSHLGGRGPGEEALRFLAGACDLPGGNIRNVVLAAASLAGEAAPIGSEQLIHALRREYRKLGRSLPGGLEMK